MKKAKRQYDLIAFGLKSLRKDNSEGVKACLRRGVMIRIISVDPESLLLSLRDEQEKYFEQMKDQMAFHTQDASSEDGKAGREFILFVGLILSSYVRNVWSRNLELRNHFRTSYAVLDEMEKIRLYEYPDGTSKMTAFNGPQVEICKAYDVKIPIECMPSADKKAEERKLAPKKRGRKPQDTPPPHKVVPVLIGV